MAESLTALLEKLGKHPLPAIDLSLARMEKLLEALGNPQRQLPPTIHVAGTNGKGSTIAFLRAIYEAAGYRVHVYSSPHLVRFNERIVLAGEEASDEVLSAAIARVLAHTANNPVTFFESTTAAAFLCFAEYPADILLLEVGMGGRLDATNVITKPIASVITPIGMDHAEFLGNTLEKIAAEKAGIMKPGCLCMTAPQIPSVERVFSEMAKNTGAQHIHAALWQKQSIPPASVALQGAHQLQNAALACAVVRALRPYFNVVDATITTGLMQAKWPARLQKLRKGMLVECWGARGDITLDGGHNGHAASRMAEWLASQPTPRLMIMGMLNSKDPKAFFAPFVGVADAVYCIPIPHTPECHAPERMAEIGRDLGIEAIFPATDALAALRQAKVYHNGTVLIAGSLYLAGEILKNHG